jgi:serine/threonine protein kinase
MTDLLERLSAAVRDRYTIQRELGRGGMAIVYLAHDLKHDRQVALKVMQPALSAILGGERFLREIRIAAKLSHPHILPLYDSGEADGLLYYVMPHVEGESLRTRLAREKQLSVDETITIAREVAAALDYAHEERIVHRDIKPENILIHRGEALVADFGIALAVTAAGGTRLTDTGLSLGTPEYMSPEQATGEREVDARSDVYSLGAVVYEMLVGEPPHQGNTVQAIIAKVISAEPQPVRSLRHTVPRNVDAAVRCALAKVPADRFASGAEFVRALTDVTFGLPAVPEAGADDRRDRGRWRGVALVLAATTLVLLGTTVGSWLRPQSARDALVTRQRIVLPGEDRFLSSGPAIATAPDGSSIVYVGPSETGVQLWLKRGDQLTATPLPGTEGAAAPTFSPDGERVAFYVSGGTLKTVSLRGEPPLTLVSSAAIDAGAMAWGTDGYVYLSGGPLNAYGIVRVAETGGPPERVITPDSARHESWHAAPAVLPHGGGILFRVCYSGRETDAGACEIAAVDLRTGRRAVLVRGMFATYVPTGPLLFVTSRGSLLAAPFDSDRLRVTGAAVPILEGVRLKDSGWDLGLSANGTLIYTRGASLVRAPRGRGTPVWVDREGRLAPVDSGWVFSIPFNHSMSLSPDGTRLAIDIFHGTADIWIKELDHGPLMRLTFEGRENVGSVWSVDGRAVAFSSNRNEGWDLYQTPADGTGTAELLVDVEGPIGDAAWSPDGQWLVLRVGGSPPLRDLLAYRPAVDSAPVPLLHGPYDEMHPHVSPDGRWLLYTSDESGRTEVYVRRFPNVGEGRWLVSTTGGTEPLWAHSGKEIFYIDDEGRMVAVDVATSPTFAVRNREVLFETASWRAAGSGWRTSYDVSPDDRRFIMVQQVGTQEAADVILVEHFLEELNQKVAR